MDCRWIKALLVPTIFLLMLYFTATQPVFAIEPRAVFRTTLLVSSANPLDVQCAQLVANELPKIGIEVSLCIISWGDLKTRVFKSSGSLTPSYTDGGYDMAFLRGNGELLPRTQYWLFHSNFTPDPNYFGVQDPTLDGMLELTVNTTDIAQRKQYIEDAWQYLTWELHPEITLYQQENTVFTRDNVRGYSSDFRVPGTLGIAEMYFEDGHSHGHGQVNEFIIASTTHPIEYNDLIENDWYNQLAIGPVNHGLVERDPDYDFVPVLLTKLPYPIAVKNNHTGIESPLDPNFATVWEIELRNDVFWHEGYGYTMAVDEDILRVDVDDVLFTFGLILDDDGPSPCLTRPNWQRLLGTDASLSVIKKDRHHVQFHLQTLDADMMGQFAQRIFPKHILSLGTIRADGSVAPSDYTDWNMDDWNLGHRTGGMTGPAVIGNGPYIFWPGEDLVKETITETKNPYWHLKDEPAYRNMFDKYIYTWITSKDAAIIALQQAEIDLMGSQFHAEIWWGCKSCHPGIFVQKSLDWNCQTIAINTAHGASGLQDSNVRLAISHIMPRQDMVDYLLNGLGQPAFMHFPKQHPFYPDDIEPICYNFTKAIEYMEAAGGGCPGPYRPSSSSNYVNILFSPSFYLSFGLLGVEVIIIGFLSVLIRKKRLNRN